jgi:hypothetical protein
MEIYTEQKTKNAFKNLIEPARKFFLQLGNYLLLIVAISAGFFIGKYYDEVFTKDNKDEQKLVITESKNVSVAISQNSELIILDRTTGNIVMFQDEVGINIFKLYANQIAGSSK